MRTIVQLIIASSGTLFLLFFLTPREVLMTYIVLGQAHFLLTYIYQAKAGKIDESYWRRYGTTVALMLAYVFLSFLFLRTSLNSLVVITGAVFALHFLLDELYLSRSLNEGSLFAVLPLFLSYTGYASDTLLGTHFVPMAIIAGVASALWYIVRCRKLDGNAWVIGLGLFFCAVAAAGNLSPEKAVGSIVLLHYMRWYIHFFVAYWGSSRLRFYVRDVFLVNILVLLCFSFYYLHHSAVILGLFFSPLCFYLWTILHVVSSVRSSDYELLSRSRV